MSTFKEEQEQVVYENKLRSEIEVKQMLRDAIDKDPEGTVWHVNTKHLMTFAQMVADKTKRGLESSPEESWVKFYEDRIAYLDEMLAKSMNMNRWLISKMPKEKQESKGNQEAWDEYIYEQGEVESKEDQKKADEAAWADARNACAAIRDAKLDAAGENAALVTAAYSNYTVACLAIDDHWDAVRAKRETWGV
jgi:hypothetical protein